MIVIAHANHVDPRFLGSLRTFFESHNVEVNMRTKERGIHNALEWALPALITLWITKSFFDGFLKEMGKDGAQALKRLIQECYAKLRGTTNRAYDADELRQVAAGESPDSIGRLGPAIDVTVEIPVGNENSLTSVTCVFPSGLDDVEIEVAVTTWLEEVLPSIQRELPIAKPTSDINRRARLVYDQSDGWLTDNEMAIKAGNAAIGTKP